MILDMEYSASAISSEIHRKQLDDVTYYGGKNEILQFDNTTEKYMESFKIL